VLSAGLLGEIPGDAFPYRFLYGSQLLSFFLLMSLKTYIWLMILGTIGAWASWFMVISFLTPEVAGVSGFAFFYLSLFIAIVGTATLVGFALRAWVHKNELVTRQASISFRQGIFVGVVVVLSLLLKDQKLFTWWNISICSQMSFSEYIVPG